MLRFGVVQVWALGVVACTHMRAYAINSARAHMPPMLVVRLWAPYGLVSHVLCEFGTEIYIDSRQYVDPYVVHVDGSWVGPICVQ